jgi:hypothetical protein
MSYRFGILGLHTAMESVPPTEFDPGVLFSLLADAVKSIHAVMPRRARGYPPVDKSQGSKKPSPAILEGCQ